VGFEVLETARALTMLKPHGTVIVNTKYIPPSGQLTGSEKTLKLESLITMIRERALKVFEVDGIALASTLRNLLVVNTILLGAVFCFT
jgi:indolepyruvate ferredoxin oxidoreductase beta subunit